MIAARSRRALAPLLTAVALAALALYAYRGLIERPFVGDDYQWLLNVRELDAGQVLRAAFDFGAQAHFYRPLVWLLFWAQARVFDLDPRGYHVVTLALHLLNAVLLGALAWRLMEQRTKNKEQRTTQRVPDQEPRTVHHPLTRSPVHPLTRSPVHSQLVTALLAAGFVALHPAPFEAVVWISAQSELLAAALLLVMLHLWLPPPTTPSTLRLRSGQASLRAGDHRPPTTEDRGLKIEDSSLDITAELSSILHPPSSILHPSRGWGRIVLTTLFLGLALLAKESAVIGLPLLLLIDLAHRRPTTDHRPPTTAEDGGWRMEDRTLPSSILHPPSSIVPRFLPYALPVLLTTAYIALQLIIEQRNYLVQAGGYGVGPQLALNPLRSLALIVAPLRGTERADAAWLVPVGAGIALALLAAFVLRGEGARLLILALLLTLAPTAPFAAPPNSRYLYLPVLAAALIIGFWIYDFGFWIRRQKTQSTIQNLKSRIGQSLVVVMTLVLAWAAIGELHAREGSFAAGGGPGGSLMRLVSAVCAESNPERMIVVEPPLAPQHAEAIVRLACGPYVRPMVVGRDGIAQAAKRHSIVISFPNGSAEIERRT